MPPPLTRPTFSPYLTRSSRPGGSGHGFGFSPGGFLPPLVVFIRGWTPYLPMLPHIYPAPPAPHHLPSPSPPTSPSSASPTTTRDPPFPDDHAGGAGPRRRGRGRRLVPPQPPPPQEVLLRQRQRRCFRGPCPRPGPGAAHADAAPLRHQPRGLHRIRPRLRSPADAVVRLSAILIERVHSGQPEAYEFKIGDKFFRRSGDPPLDQVIEMLQKHKDKSQDEI
ncbi:formin-like protein 5 [Triticum aestivum]|uniref:formin-like protein 5 n=1 Tax=Triticum aestivum TaxID=4565 RepID=UPI001D01816D|nr:formin-like protein 5 [Triticum aestivum]